MAFLACLAGLATAAAPTTTSVIFKGVRVSAMSSTLVRIEPVGPDGCEFTFLFIMIGGSPRAA